MNSHISLKYMHNTNMRQGDSLYSKETEAPNIRQRMTEIWKTNKPHPKLSINNQLNKRAYKRILSPLLFVITQQRQNSFIGALFNSNQNHFHEGNGVGLWVF